MKQAYIGVNGIAKKAKKIYCGIDNVAHNIKKIYVGDENNIAQILYTNIIFGLLTASYDFIMDYENTSLNAKLDYLSTDYTNRDILETECPECKVIVFPYSIDKIGKYAFNGCKQLVNVILPDTLTEISDGMFSDCSNLDQVEIPDNFNKMPDKAFQGTNLKRFSFGNQIKEIGEYAFANCNNLKEIIFKNNIVKIGKYAFSKTAVENLDLPDGIVEIEDHAFSESNVKTIDFSNINKLVKLSGFDKTELTSIDIPSSVEEIGNEAFAWTKITEIDIPNNVKKIANGSFAKSSLKTVTLPNSIKSIDKSAFSFTDIENVCIPNNIEYLTGFDSTYISNATIPESVNTIGEKCFYNCSSLEVVNIPDSVNRIDDHAFSDCVSLKSISLPNSLKNIGEGCFKNCSNITGSLSIPNGVTRIPKEAFMNCTGITEVIIPNSVIFIDETAFYGCTSIVKINVPSSVDNADFLYWIYYSDNFTYSYKEITISLSENIKSVKLRNIFIDEKISDFFPKSLISLTVDNLYFSEPGDCLDFSSFDNLKNLSIKLSRNTGYTNSINVPSGLKKLILDGLSVAKTTGQITVNYPSELKYLKVTSANVGIDNLPTNLENFEYTGVVKETCVLPDNLKILTIGSDTSGHNYSFNIPSKLEELYLQKGTFNFDTTSLVNHNNLKIINLYYSKLSNIPSNSNDGKYLKFSNRLSTFKIEDNSEDIDTLIVPNSMSSLHIDMKYFPKLSIIDSDGVNSCFDNRLENLHLENRGTRNINLNYLNCDDLINIISNGKFKNLFVSSITFNDSNALTNNVVFTNEIKTFGLVHTNLFDKVNKLTFTNPIEDLICCDTDYYPSVINASSINNCIVYKGNGEDKFILNANYIKHLEVKFSIKHFTLNCQNVEELTIDNVTENVSALLDKVIKKLYIYRDTSITNFPNGLDYIEICGYDDSTLTDIVFPDDTKTVTVSSCPNVKSIILPKYLETVPKFSFSNLPLIKDIYVPDRIAEVGKESFGVRHITYHGKLPGAPWRAQSYN